MFTCMKLFVLIDLISGNKSVLLLVFQIDFLQSKSIRLFGSET